jgi:hypothetical protein
MSKQRAQKKETMKGRRIKGKKEGVSRERKREREEAWAGAGVEKGQRGVN